MRSAKRLREMAALPAEELAELLNTGVATKGFGPRVTHQQALQFGCREEGFHTGVRYRDEPVRKVAVELVKLKLFKSYRHKRYGDGVSYFITDKGREVLEVMKVK